jgi:DNA-binding GntR family transcriptional regulator
MAYVSRSEELPSVRVATDLRKRALSGEWPSGQALPPVATLAEHYQVSRATVARAMRMLESEKLVRIVPRWGTFRT